MSNRGPGTTIRRGERLYLIGRVGRACYVDDMICLRYAGRCDGCTARTIAAHRLLGRRAPPLGKAGDVVRRVTHRIVFTQPTIFQRNLRIGVAVRFVRRTLAAAAGSHASSLPARFGERRIALAGALRRAAIATLLV